MATPPQRTRWLPLIPALVAVSAAAAPGGEVEPPRWPIFRGGPELRGTADVTLPAKPTLRWRFETGRKIESSPVLGHGNAYIGSGDTHVYAIRLSDGERVWRYKTDAPVEAPPTLHNGSVLVGSHDGFLYSLDAETGKLRWKFETQAKIVGAANAIADPNNEGRTLVLVGSHDARLYAVDAETGEGVWVYETDNFINAAVAVDEGRAIFGGCDGFLHVVDAGTGEAVRRIKVGSYIAGSAAMRGRFAYVGHYGNRFLAADLEAGRIVWRYEPTRRPYFGSPAVTERRVLFGGRDKRLHCLDRETGEPIWRLATRGKIDSSPVVAAERVVFGSADGRVYIVGRDDGEEVWSYEVGQAITGSPAVAEGLIVIGAHDGAVYAFGGPKRSGGERAAHPGG